MGGSWLARSTSCGRKFRRAKKSRLILALSTSVTSISWCKKDSIPTAPTSFERRSAINSIVRPTRSSSPSRGAVPLFGVFLGAIVLAMGGFVLWLEMIIRDAAIYIGLFFIPLTFIAMIWPATSRYARRLVEFLIAVILAKFVIVAIIGLASAAITNAGGTGDGGQGFERMIAASFTQGRTASLRLAA